MWSRGNQTDYSAGDCSNIAERERDSQPKGTCVDQWPEPEHAFNRLGRAQLMSEALLCSSHVVVTQMHAHRRPSAPHLVPISSVSGKEILLHPFSSRTSFKLLLVVAELTLIEQAAHMVIKSKFCAH
jgi:hypothetical protein